MLLRAIAVFSSHLCQAPGPHAHRRAHGALSHIQLNPVACTNEVPPLFPLPPCRCNSAPAWAVPACQVRTHPRLFRLFRSCSCASPCYSPQARHAPTAHSSACPHSPTLARRAPRPPARVFARPPARVFARPPARGFARLPARTPAHAFTLPRPLPPSRSPLSSPGCNA